MNNSPLFTATKSMHYRVQGGFSITELMVAMTLGLFLSAGIIQIYISNRHTNRLNSAVSAIQENGRFAQEMLTNAVRQAAGSGCPVTNSIDPLSTTPPWWQDFDNPLQGFDGTAAFSAVAFGTSAGDRVSGTDAIIALGTSGGYFLTSTTGTPTSAITLTTLTQSVGSTLSVNDMGIICNSTDTSLFQVGSIVGNTVNFASAATVVYGTDATVVDYVPTAFYIGVSTSGTNRSLYQIELSGGAMVAQELVEGVEDMQLFYGVDTTGPDANGDLAADTYQTATTVTAGNNWSNVTSVRIYLLLSSVDEDNLIDQAQTYLFTTDSGTDSNTLRPLQATDRRLYRVFSTTANIRNRL